MIELYNKIAQSNLKGEKKMKKRYILILMAIMFNFLSGCSQNEKQARDIPVFLYHIVKPELVEGDNPEMVVTTEDFEKDLKYLKDNGYTSIDLKTLKAYYEDPSVTLPEKPFLITFDDGYLNNYEYAYPLLKEYDTRAIIYTIVWSVGRDKFILNDNSIIPHFTWEQGREMIESGLIELGSHTYDLHNPEGLSYGHEIPCGYGVEKMDGEDQDDHYDRIYKDIKKSKDLMEENLGVEINSFAYPYGIYNDTVIKVLKDLNFETAFITANDEKDKSIFEMRRHSVSNGIRIANIFEK